MSTKFYLTEEEKKNILNQHILRGYSTFISEQVITNYDNVYDYKREGDNFFTKRKGSENWIKLSGSNLEAVKNKVFKLKKSTEQKKNNVNPWLDPSKITDPSKIQQQNDFNVTKIGFTPPRVLTQLQYLKNQKILNDVSFLIINKDEATVSLYDKNYNFIKKSFITSGRSKDVTPGNTDENKTYNNWFKTSLDFFEKNPNHVDTKKYNKWLQDTNLSYDKVKTMDYKDISKLKFPFPFSYTAPKEANLDYTPTGFYGLDVNKGYNVKYFAGSEYNRNVFPLINLDTNEIIPPAIHGAAGSERSKLIDQAYRDSKSLKNYTRAGAGCVNVTSEFIAKVLEHKPTYVIILPDDSSNIVENLKITTFKTFSEKIADLGERCVKSLFDLFPSNVSLNPTNNV
jgi:hypothetical protein